MTPDGVRKPTWFAYKYLADLGDRELSTRDDQSIAALKGDTVQVLAWRDVLPEQLVSNRSFFREVRPPAKAAPLNLSVAGLKPGSYQVRVRRTGFRQNDAYTAYLEMGRPAKLTEGQLRQLQSLTTDAPVVSTVRMASNGTARLDLPMRDNDVVMVELSPR
jgi:xylan 1,4-beta-xylosidase